MTQYAKHVRRNKQGEVIQGPFLVAARRRADMLLKRDMLHAVRHLETTPDGRRELRRMQSDRTLPRPGGKGYISGRQWRIVRKALGRLRRAAGS